MTLYTLALAGCAVDTAGDGQNRFGERRVGM
jgi:hypothetical protein